MEKYITIDVVDDKAQIKEDLFKYLLKQFPATEFRVIYYGSTGKDHNFTLDFGDDEIIDVTIRERKGNNGNYRLTGMM